MDSPFHRQLPPLSRSTKGVYPSNNAPSFTGTMLVFNRRPFRRRYNRTIRTRLLGGHVVISSTEVTGFTHTVEGDGDEPEEGSCLSRNEHRDEKRIPRLGTRKTLPATTTSFCNLHVQHQGGELRGFASEFLGLGLK